MFSNEPSSNMHLPVIEDLDLDQRTSPQIREERCLQVLAATHAAIFTVFGDTLKNVDITDPISVKVSKQRQKEARAAWELAEQHAQDCFGYITTCKALQRLGL